MLRRYGVLMGAKARERLEARLASLRKNGGEAAVEAELDRLRARMHDLSQFVKTFKVLRWRVPVGGVRVMELMGIDF